MEALDVLGVAEVAALIGAERKTVAAYLSRGNMPVPDARLACGPIWKRETVSAWLNGRQLAAWKKRLAELERKHGKIVEAIAGREAPPEEWRRREQLSRNYRNAKKKRRGRVATVSEQLQCHAARLLVEAVEAHPDDPVMRKLAAELDEVNLLELRIARAEQRAFDKAVAA